MKFLLKCLKPLLKVRVGTLTAEEVELQVGDRLKDLFVRESFEPRPEAEGLLLCVLFPKSHPYLRVVIALRALDANQLPALFIYPQKQPLQFLLARNVEEQADFELVLPVVIIKRIESHFAEDLLLSLGEARLQL